MIPGTRGRLAQEHFRWIVDQSKVGIWSIDIAGTTDYVNPALTNLLGYTAAEMLGRRFNDFVNPVSALSADSLPGHPREGLSDRGHCELVTRDGSLIPIQYDASPIVDDHGDVVGALSMVTDVTGAMAHGARLARHPTETHERDEDLTRFGELADSLPQIVWSVRGDGRHEYFNRRWYEMTRASRPDEQNWRELLHPDDRDAVGVAWERARQTGVMEAEYRMRFPGEPDYRWYLARALPVCDNSGSVVRWYGTSTDIDAQKRHEVLLTSKRHILEMIAAGAPLADTLEAITALIETWWPDGIASVMLVDDQGRLHTGSAPRLPEAYSKALDGAPIGPAAGSCGTAAYRRERVIVRDITTSDLWADYRDLAEEHGLRACWSVPIITNADQLVGTLAVYYREPREPRPGETDFATDSGAALAAIAIQRVRTEEALAEQTRALDAANQNKDQFIAKLAHELRNPLGAIQAAVQVMKTRTPAGSPLQHPHAVVERQAAHIARLIDDLRDLALIARGEMRVLRHPVDLRTVVDDAVETVRAQAVGRDQSMTIQAPPAPVIVDGDAARLTQVFLNLLGNAVKYTKPGGHVDLTMSVDGGEAMTRIRDNGLGIAPAMLPRIFGLYTQAEDANAHAQGGMGIGLHLVQNLVALHGGTVTATSDGAGHGSTFEVRLPLLT
jgi:PAS domain S-box-containing protein